MSAAPPEWVGQQLGGDKPEGTIAKFSAAVAPVDVEDPVADPVKPVEDEGAEASSLKVVSKREHWLDTHHNPDSPIHSPPRSPDRDPVGQEKHERWEHWLFQHQKRHGLVKDDELEGPVASKSKKRRGWLKGTFHALASEKPAKYRQIFALMGGIVLLGAWGTALWLVKGRKAAPKGDIFALLCVWVFSFCLGEAVCSFTHPLLGSILAGFILRLIPVINPQLYIIPQTQGHVRSLALVVILS